MLTIPNNRSNTKWEEEEKDSSVSPNMVLKQVGGGVARKLRPM
jgi:hypothetical protein